MRIEGKDGNSNALKIGAVLLVLGGLVAARYYSGDRPIVQPATQESAQTTQDEHAGHNHAPGEHPGESASQSAAPNSVAPSGAGLKKTDVKVGTGKTAKAGDKVSVNYRGTLQNGTMFDQSYGKQPFEFVLGAGQVIKGWDQGVAGMKEGGKRKLVIPPDLAYGAGGTPGGPIPPNATLNFDVELLKVG